MNFLRFVLVTNWNLKKYINDGHRVWYLTPWKLIGNVICLYLKNYWKFKKKSTFSIFWQQNYYIIEKKIETGCAGLCKNYHEDYDY